MPAELQGEKVTLLRIPGDPEMNKEQLPLFPTFLITLPVYRIQESALSTCIPSNWDTK
jgi:hypothetical protein